MSGFIKQNTNTAMYITIPVDKSDIKQIQIMVKHCCSINATPIIDSKIYKTEDLNKCETTPNGFILKVSFKASETIKFTQDEEWIDVAIILNSGEMLPTIPVQVNMIKSLFSEVFEDADV